MCKDMNDRLVVSLAERDGEPVSTLEAAKPALLHGRAAAMLLQSDFCVTDEDILEAVRNHTFGRPGMCVLAKILYAADKIEPGRSQVTQAYHDQLFSLTLDELVVAVIEENIAYLAGKDRRIAPVTFAFLESFGKGGQLQ
jgi:nicotinate-nucleotide adenylyltransferase